MQLCTDFQFTRAPGEQMQYIYAHEIVRGELQDQINYIINAALRINKKPKSISAVNGNVTNMSKHVILFKGVLRRIKLHQVHGSAVLLRQRRLIVAY